MQDDTARNRVTSAAATCACTALGVHFRRFGSGSRQAFLLAVSLAAGPGLASAQPSIEARVRPTPNASGWNNSPVTVSFVCQNAVTCPEPVVFAEDGTNWRVSRTVADADGREASASAVVNIDRTPPRVAISAPAPQTVTPGRSIAVTSNATDSGSGLARATCNGIAAKIDGDAVSCTVTLRPGMNGVIVQVMDAAGNSGSTGLQVAAGGPPTRAFLLPSNGTLAQGEVRSLALSDEFGRPLTDAVWAISNPLVARLERAGADVVLRGLGPGAVTVTAVRGPLSAQAQLTVAPGRKLAAGTTRWTVPTGPGRVLTDTIYTHPTPEGPELFTIARETSTGDILMTALTAEPRLLWIESPALRADETIVDKMGEEFGGVLLKVDGPGPAPSSIVRVGQPSLGPLWRYEAVGRIAKGFAQGWDATVYFIETGADGFPHLVGLDGATGMAKFRWPIPRSTLSQLAPACGKRYATEMPAGVGRVSVPDGRVAAFTFVTEHETKASPACGEAASWSRVLHLARVTADGNVDVRELTTFDETARTSRLTPRMVIPHYDTAVLAPWTETRADGSLSHVVARVARDQSRHYSLPFMGELGIGDDTAYTVTDDERTVVVFDPASGRVRYIRHASQLSVTMVTADGGIVLFNKGPLLDENMKPVPGPAPAPR